MYHASHAEELFLAHHEHLDGLCITAPEEPRIEVNSAAIAKAQGTQK